MDVEEVWDILHIVEVEPLLRTIITVAALWFSIMARNSAERGSRRAGRIDKKMSPEFINEVRSIREELEEIKDWRSSYANLPWRAGKDVSDWIKSNSRDIAIVQSRIAALEGRLEKVEKLTNNDDTHRRPGI